MTIFNTYLLPLLKQARLLHKSTNMTPQRKEGYKMVEELLWRCMRPFTRAIDMRINYEEVFILVEGELKNVSENTLGQLALAMEHLSNILVEQDYKSKGAESLIKALAMILNIKNGSAKQILKAIQGLSKISSPDYIKRVFDKNIEKMIILG